MSVIEVKNISREFEYYKKDEGMKNSLKNLVKREKLIKKAVKCLNFKINEGEIVGLLGANGAGKTTIIKILSGIIYPTSGDVKVLGYIPWERKNEFKKQIAVVMAQKNQLWWDLPANESILLNKYIYEIPDEEYNETLSELIDLFGVRDLLSVQVRRLSLGERMKFEIIASLIHRPRIIFLDEPTIGLDLIAQKEMRNFIKEYNRKYNATIILTSHYMKDIEELCDRAIVINQGEKVYDGLLNKIQSSDNKIISFKYDEGLVIADNFLSYGIIKEVDKGYIKLEVEKDNIKDCLSYIVNNYDVTDLSIEDLQIEEGVVALYK